MLFSVALRRMWAWAGCWRWCWHLMIGLRDGGVWSHRVNPVRLKLICCAWDLNWLILMQRSVWTHGSKWIWSIFQYHRCTMESFFWHTGMLNRWNCCNDIMIMNYNDYEWNANMTLHLQGCNCKQKNVLHPQHHFWSALTRHNSSVCALGSVGHWVLSTDRCTKEWGPPLALQTPSGATCHAAHSNHHRMV